MANEQILIADDDPEITRLVRSYLEQAGYRVVVAKHGAEAWQMIRHTKPDLLVLDVMMPHKDGWEVTRMVRGEAKSADLPILMLTARIDDLDKIIGLELGADDYLTKPFNPRELVARVRALLRRSRPINSQNSVRIGELELNPQQRIVTRNDQELDLTPTEFQLLKLFMENPRTTLTRDELLEKALGYQFGGLDRTLDSHIKNLRRKIGDDGRETHYIETVYGVGYRFMEPIR